MCTCGKAGASMAHPLHWVGELWAQSLGCYHCSHPKRGSGAFGVPLCRGTPGKSLLSKPVCNMGRTILVPSGGVRIK